ncbi:hypothetical protein [Streptomyces cylindrosporus]|uniref:Integrase n=1 Tax=Streptomyces cylindrosporus TaxID=2927583 RepID=A0ABS9Y810_9ACTN|nr:hypothetical protein [Streptomyces cylindrosporus]MCI3273369.1 hypothetical protein [Streptomyces cylindrosporus]
MTRTLRHRGMRGLAGRADPQLAAWVEQFTKQRAARHGWNRDLIWCVRTGVNIMLGFQDTPGVAIAATDVSVLSEVDLPIAHVLEVLDDARLLDDDRTPAVTAWVQRSLSGLPESMTSEVWAWFRIMREGSSTTPRRRPRTEITIRLHLGWALPALRQWAEDGKDSLREISSADVRAVLPQDGITRAQMGQGLRSIFRLLKASRLLFTNPIAQIKTGFPDPKVPLPLNVEDIREALDSPDPARALLTSLFAFHGLSSIRVQHLLLTDIHDGRLELAGRSVPLAAPVRRRLANYLDHRNRHWPKTANPHLFVHFRTVNGTGHVGYRWIYLLLGPNINARSLREDRFLDEALATNGDARRLSDLFGLSTQAAQRYTEALDHPGFRSDLPANEHHPSPSSGT